MLQKTPKVSIITTCMNRLDHLKKTLPTHIHDDVEVILVDWSCGENCGDWVEENYPTVKVVRVHDKKYFEASTARNIGFTHATGDWIACIDADMYLKISLFFNYYKHLDQSNYYVRMPCNTSWEGNKYPHTVVDDAHYRSWGYEDGIIDYEKTSSYGLTIFHKDVLAVIGGYDETFGSLYGCEDTDIRLRMQHYADTYEFILPRGISDVIQHSNAMRTEHRSVDNINQSTLKTLDFFMERWRKYVFKSNTWKVRQKVHPMKMRDENGRPYKKVLTFKEHGRIIRQRKN